LFSSSHFHGLGAPRDEGMYTVAFLNGPPENGRCKVPGGQIDAPVYEPGVYCSLDSQCQAGGCGCSSGPGVSAELCVAGTSGLNLCPSGALCASSECQAGTFCSSTGDPCPIAGQICGQGSGFCEFAGTCDVTDDACVTTADCRFYCVDDISISCSPPSLQGESMVHERRRRVP